MRRMICAAILFGAGIATANTNMTTKAERLYFNGKTLQIVDSGILASGYVMTELEWRDYAKARAAANASIKESEAKTNRASEADVYKTANLIGTLKFWLKWKEDNTRTCLITGTPSNLIDGDKWSGLVVESGVYQYINTAGAKATVRKYRVYERQNVSEEEQKGEQSAGGDGIPPPQP